MRLGLIGSTGHWQTYAPAIEHVAGLTLVAVAPAGPEETTGVFDHAPGLTMDTRRHDDAQKMLETERLDVVQVCGCGDRIPHWARICLERGLPVLAEKPLAMDLPTLEGLFQLARKKKLALVPMHTMRGDPALAAMRRAVRGGGLETGTQLVLDSSWGWKQGRSQFLILAASLFLLGRLVQFRGHHS